MPRKRRGSEGQGEVVLVMAEEVSEQPGEGQLMVAMQPGATEIPVEMPALGVEEVVIVTENAEASGSADGDPPVPFTPSSGQVTTVAAVEEVKDNSSYAEIARAATAEQRSNREVAEFLAATGSGRPIGSSHSSMGRYQAPRKQIKLETPLSGPETESDSAEETSDSDDDLPRKTPRKRDFAHRLQWRNRDMLEAMKSVEDKKMTIRGAAKKFGVPYSTLKDRVHGRVRHGTKPGVKTVLSPEEEEELVKYIRDMETAGFQMKHIDVRDRAGELLRLNHGHNSPYKDCSPGHNWLSGFMKRHPGLEFRRTCHRISVPSLSKQKQMLRRFYDLANHVFKRNKLFNRPEKVYVVSEIRFGQYNEHTVLVAASADGKVLPPFVIFRGQRMKQMAAARQEFPEAFFTCSFDGMVNEDIFLWWFRDHFLKKIPHSGHRPCALFLSRNISDITIQLVQLAKEEKVNLVGIPCGVAHLLQPFDEELTKHIAGMIERRIKKYEEENNVHVVPHKGVAHILQKVWKKAIEQEEITRKFAANGLFPLNVSAISNERIITGAAQLKEYQQKMAAPSPASGALSGLTLLSALSSHEYASLEHLYDYGSQENLNQSFDQESTTSDKASSEYSTPKSKVVVSMLEDEAQKMDTASAEPQQGKSPVKTERVTEQESLLMKTLLKEQDELRLQAKAKQRQSSRSSNLLERKTDIREIAESSSKTEQINRAIDSILEKGGSGDSGNSAAISTRSRVVSSNPRVVTIPTNSRTQPKQAPKKSAPVKIYKVSLVRREQPVPAKAKAKPKSPASTFVHTSTGTIRITKPPPEENVEEEVVEELVEEMLIQEEQADIGGEMIRVKLHDPDDGEVAQTSETQLYREEETTEVPQQEFQMIQQVQAQLPEEILQGEYQEDMIHTEEIKMEPGTVASASQLGIHVNVDQSGIVQLAPGAEQIAEGVEYVTESGDVITQDEIQVAYSGGQQVQQLQQQPGESNWHQIVDENGHVIQMVQQVNNELVVSEEQVVQGGYIIRQGDQEYIVDLPVSADGSVPEVVWEEQVS